MKRCLVFLALLGCDDGGGGTAPDGAADGSGLDAARVVDVGADGATPDGPNADAARDGPVEAADGATARDGGQEAPDAAEPEDHAAAQARIFGAREILQAEVTLSELAWARLVDEPRDTWVPGGLTIDGQHFPRVRMKLKGTRGSFRRIDQKAALKIQLDAYVPDAHFHGLRTLTFNNMIQDVTKMRERLASLAFQRFGIYAPRVGYLELSVNGTPYGLYAHVETPDATFLRRMPGQDGRVGLLYEGGNDYDLWLRDLDGFDRDEGEDPDREALRSLVRAVDASTPHTLEGRLGEELDMDALRLFLAAEVMTGHWDGYGQLRNNYFLYRRPSDDRWVFLPWGTDQTWQRTGNAYSGPGRLLRMCADWMPCRLPYSEVVERLAERLESFDWNAEIDRLAALTEEPFSRDRKTPTRPQQRIDGIENMRRWIYDHPDRIRGRLSCLDPAEDADGDGVAPCAGDCDDAEPSVYPNANDTCHDEIDQDCTGFTDDGQHCPECREAVMEGGPTFLLCHRPQRRGIARQQCEAFGGILASIHSAEENDFVTTAAFARKQTRWYLGAWDYPDEGVWRWEDETPFDYENWNAGEPDDRSNAEDCLVFGQRGAAWSDVYCGVYAPYVCRMPE